MPNCKPYARTRNKFDGIKTRAHNFKYYHSPDPKMRRFEHAVSSAISRPRIGNIEIIESPLEGAPGAILPDPAPMYLSGNFPGKDIFQ